MLIINVDCLPAWRVWWCCIVIGSEFYHNWGPITHSIVITMLVWINTANPLANNNIKSEPQSEGRMWCGEPCRLADWQTGLTSSALDIISAVRTNCHLLAFTMIYCGAGRRETSQGSRERRQKMSLIHWRVKTTRPMIADYNSEAAQHFLYKW